VIRILPVPVLSVLLLGCHNATDVSGFYVLMEIDSLQVPRVVSATVFCDELVLTGLLHLTAASSFELSVVQAQDCTRNGAAVDTFRTTTSGTFSVNRTQLALHPAGTGLQLTGTSSGGIVDLQLPPLPLVPGGSHSGRFLIFPE